MLDVVGERSQIPKEFHGQDVDRRIVDLSNGDAIGNRHGHSLKFMNLQITTV